MKVACRIMDEDDINKLMAANYLVQSYADIVHNILTIDGVSVNKNRFEEFLDQYSDKFIYYEILKRNTVFDYIPTNVSQEISGKWNISFDNRTLSIEISDEDESAFKEWGFEISEA